MPLTGLCRVVIIPSTDAGERAWEGVLPGVGESA